jgi:hypothetical protein
MIGSYDRAYAEGLLLTVVKSPPDAARPLLSA